MDDNNTQDSDVLYLICNYMEHKGSNNTLDYSLRQYVVLIL